MGEVPGEVAALEVDTEVVHLEDLEDHHLVVHPGDMEVQLVDLEDLAMGLDEAWVVVMEDHPVVLEDKGDLEVEDSALVDNLAMEDNPAMEDSLVLEVNLVSEDNLVLEDNLAMVAKADSEDNPVLEARVVLEDKQEAMAVRVVLEVASALVDMLTIKPKSLCFLYEQY
jgi:hypothetical protein